MSEEKFTWVPFYKELAEKLLAYKDNRKKLLEIVYSLSDDYVNYLYEKDKNKLEDICPFTFFGIFNRGGDGRRIDILGNLKNRFNISSTIPSDLCGIPTLNNQNSWFFSFKESRNQTDIDDLWNIFVSAILNDSNLQSNFDKALKVKGTGIKYLTFGLYWVEPNNFLPLDDNNKEYLKYYGVYAEKIKDYDSYAKLLNEIKDKMNSDKIKEKSFPKFSYNARKRNNNKGDATMPNPNDKIISLMDLLEANRNLILHGAPGTGKTHTAKDIAAQMICGKSYAEVEKDEALNKLFNEQTEFVQFHPSYDYSDFVEGLRPIEGDNRGDVGFERKDGVFKEFCKGALKANYNDGVDNFDEAWEKLFEYLNENDFIDVQLLSGKNNFRVELNEYGDGLANRTYENDAFEKGNWIKGQSKFFSKEQLYNIYKGLKGVPKGGHDNYRKAVVAKMKSDFGLKDYKVGTETVKKKNFIFIIDEINRGEMSKIFGELFFSIDPDYRGTKGKVRTQYANMLEDSNDFDDALGIATSYGHFFVPENVYIIGTMNDIDRSVDSMDFAMRRRFTFMELKANECLAMLDGLQFSDGISKDDIIAKMTALNSEIEKTPGLSSAYHIGGSYFAKLSKYADKPKDEAYKCLWNNHLKPLLTDYLRGLPNLEDKLSSFKTKYDEAEFVAPKNSDD